MIPMPRLLRLGAAAASVVLVIASPAVCAAENAPAWADGWRITTQSPYGFTSGAAPGSFFFRSTPGAAFTAPNGTRNFNDMLAARSLGFARDLGLDTMQATIGARMAEPLITNGFTPAYDDRRYSGIGPRVGLEGSRQLQPSLSLDWQFGAAMLFGNRGSDNAGTVTSVLPYSASNSSVVNVDGLLGLSYWFNAASKLTVGYRADAYLKDSTNFAVPSSAKQSTDRIDHGPMVRFTIQK